MNNEINQNIESIKFNNDFSIKRKLKSITKNKTFPLTCFCIFVIIFFLLLILMVNSSRISVEKNLWIKYSFWSGFFIAAVILAIYNLIYLLKIFLNYQENKKMEWDYFWAVKIISLTSISLIVILYYLLSFIVINQEVNQSILTNQLGPWILMLFCYDAFFTLLLFLSSYLKKETFIKIIYFIVSTIVTIVPWIVIYITLH